MVAAVPRTLAGLCPPLFSYRQARNAAARTIQLVLRYIERCCEVGLMPRCILNYARNKLPEGAPAGICQPLTHSHSNGYRSLRLT